MHFSNEKDKVQQRNKGMIFQDGDDDYSFKESQFIDYQVPEIKQDIRQKGIIMDESATPNNS